ncbi:uncharacterized protein [Panulirus ornatus]|uniref:uncharacterized protein isoform X2 n=1 Tax=Panulirus ornatus TaxID=150431 RepID=UPI003A843925
MVRVLPPGCCCCSYPVWWLLICCCLVGVGAGGKWRGRRPEFGTADESVTVREGQTARLPCVVLHLNDRAVTWLRRRDLHILTTGHHTYSADDRFQVVHSPGSNQWTLVVRYAQLRDSGIYECQVNADPKISRPITLNVYNSSQPISVRKTKVFVANNTASTRDGHLRVEILGPRERYIEEGSSLTLSCLVTSSFGPSTLVYWYHDTRMIDYTSPRGGIKLKIDHERGETTARLIVETVGIQDSGMYSCVPSGSHPASVRVHVQQGEQEAAIQQGGLNVTSSSVGVTPLTVLPCLLPLILLCIPHILLSLPLPHSYLPLLLGLYSTSSSQGCRLPLPHMYVCITIIILAKETYSLRSSLKIFRLKYFKDQIAHLSCSLIGHLSCSLIGLCYPSSTSRSCKIRYLTLFSCLSLHIFTLLNIQHFSLSLGYIQILCWVNITLIFIYIYLHVSRSSLSYPARVFSLYPILSLAPFISHLLLPLPSSSLSSLTLLLSPVARMPHFSRSLPTFLSSIIKDQLSPTSLVLQLLIYKCLTLYI